jgi:hypothetical protein
MDKPHRTPTVTIDGKPVKMTQVTTTIPTVTMTEDNILQTGTPETGKSAAHGWAALVGPLDVGTHTILITDPTGTTPTTIVVE